MNPSDPALKEISSRTLVDEFAKKLAAPAPRTARYLTAAAMVLGLLYGFLAWKAGHQFSMQYSGIITFVCILFVAAQHSTNHRIALLLQLVRELEEKRESEPKP